MKRLLAGLLAFFLLLLLVPGLALYWLAATEPGLRWLLREASARISAVAVERVEGTFLEGFILHGLVYQSSAIEVRLAELDVRWEPRVLWQRRLHFRSIHAQGLQVSLKGEEGGSEPPAWPQWTLPLDVAIEEARLVGGNVRTTADAEPIVIDRLDTALHLAREGLTVARFDLAMPILKAGLSGSVGFTGERTVALKTAWTLALAGRPEIKAAGAVVGNPERLEIRQSLEAPVPAEVMAVLSDPLDKLGWTMQLEVPRFSPQRLDPAWKPWPLALTLQGQGMRAEAAATGTFSAEIPEVGEAQGRLQANYRAPGEVVVEALDLALPRTGTDFHLEGKAEKLQENPEFTVSARWRNLVWPPSPKTDKFAGSELGQAEPGAKRKPQGRGAHKFAGSELGRAEPGAKRKPQGRGGPWRSPEGRLDVSGSLKDFRFEADGKLRNFRVQAEGNIGIEPDRTVLRGFRVLGAGAKMAVDGVLGPRLDFAWTLEAADLGLWVPGAQGRMKSRGTLQGTRTAPEGEAELAARGLRYAGNGVDELNLNLKAGLQPDSPFVLNLSADDLSAAGQRLDIALAGQGTRARHRLTGRITSSPGANLDGRSPARSASPRDGAGHGAVTGREAAPRSRTEPPSRLDFLAEGGFRDDGWTGSIVRFDFTVPPAGSWDLRRPATLRLGAESSELGRACWGGEGADACLEAKFAGAGDWRLAAELSRLPLTRFQNAMPEGAAVAGFLNATARFSGKGGLIGEGRLILDVADSRLDYRGEGGSALRFEPRPLMLEALVSGRAGKLRLAAEQAGVASLHGQASIEGALDPARLKQARLAGGAQARLQNLALLDPFLPQIEKLRGSFNADLRFAGTASAPALKLDAAVPDAGFALPPLGINVRNVNLRATTGEDGTVALQGRAASGSGEIRLAGEATLNGEAGWPMHLNVTGNRFLAADIPEAKVYVSPDLGIGFEQGRLQLQGEITVPEASLRAPERPGAVKPSGDVVLVGAEAPPEEPGLPIETHVDVRLGNKVEVQGAGFTGRVDGHVFIDQTPNGPALGTGEIGVRDGKYALYGVELAVDNGRLLFAHSPIENPGLDLNATRRVDNVLAGVRVLGTLNKPNVTLYSDPPMAQTDILAYLVTGKPFGLASQQEGSLLQGAAASLGGSVGGFLAKEVSSRLGLGELVDVSVQSSLYAQGFPQGYRPGQVSGAQSTALFLGRYLTPKLYVQYGMGLFRNAYVFRVRYDLAKHWKLQTETGQFSGGDILYQWER